MSGSDPELQLPVALTLDSQAGPAARVPRDRLAAMVATALDEYDRVSPVQATKPASTAAKVSPWTLAAGAALAIVSGAAAARYYFQSQAAEPPPVAAPRAALPAHDQTPRAIDPALGTSTSTSGELDEPIQAAPAEAAPDKAADRGEVSDGPAARAPAALSSRTLDKARRGANAPEDLLQKANHQRSGGRFREAAQTYSLVWERFPKTQAAYVAHVAAGSLELEHLSNPIRARKLFEQALSERPRGALDLEARQGLSVALRDLEDRSGEREVLRALVKLHPGSPAARRAQVRLIELGGE